MHQLTLLFMFAEAECFSLAKYPVNDSNAHQMIRSHLSYPLNEEGMYRSIVSSGSSAPLRLHKRYTLTLYITEKHP